MLTVCCWKWGHRFQYLHVNVLRAALERHLHIPHELVCVTEDGEGIDPDVRIVPLPYGFRETPRCRRRMEQYDAGFSAALGSRILYIDLDVVLVDDITPIVNRTEPIVCWKVGHAGVFSGSFVLANAGELHEAWQRFAQDPEGYPARLQPRGVASDQAMINDYLSRRAPIPFWTEADGFVTYYGKGYERLEHLGVGPRRTRLPVHARIVVLGSADLQVLENPTVPWIRKHWYAIAQELVG